MRTFSDLSVGERRRAEPRTVTASDIVAFAEQFDPQPMHCDTDDPIASGWHTAAMTMDAMVECWLSEVAVDVGLGVDALRWPRPVRPGDRLVTTVEVAACDSYDDRRGRVALDVETTVEERTVLTMTGLVLVHRESGTN